MALKAVLFDLDGTLLDTAPDFITVLNQLLTEENCNTLSDGAIRKTVSEGARALITLGFGLKEGEPGFERLKTRLLELYLAGLAEKTAPFPGISELISHLHSNDIAWGIVTNKPSVYTAPIMDAMAFHPAPLSVICPDHVSQTKPHPEPLIKACAEIGCESHEAIYVGDHARDIEAGKRAGMITIAAGYGYVPQGDCATNWQADHTVNHAAEILPILQKKYLP
ncbi:MAG: HAD-IA family hydrolase [Cellvibrionaceae bacterium]